MIMSPGLRKFALTAHITTSVGLLGTVAVFLTLAITGLISQDVSVVRAIYVALELMAWFVIAPLALTSLLIGIVQSLGTRWGLFHHYWVLVKLILTSLATIVLLLQMRLITAIGTAAANSTLAISDLSDAKRSLVLHSGGGLLVLLATVILSVYKPRGRTRYGWREQRELRALSEH